MEVNANVTVRPIDKLSVALDYYLASLVQHSHPLDLPSNYYTPLLKRYPAIADSYISSLSYLLPWIIIWPPDVMLL